MKKAMLKTLLTFPSVWLLSAFCLMLGMFGFWLGYLLRFALLLISALDGHLVQLWVGRDMLCPFHNLVST